MLNKENKDELTAEVVADSDVYETNQLVYEVGYLLVPVLSEAEVVDAHNSIINSISTIATESISNQVPKLISLSYPMYKVRDGSKRKFDSAYFGWVKFLANTDKIALVKSMMEKNQDVVRFLLIKTFREDLSVAPKRSHAGYRNQYNQVKTEVSPLKPINKEEIDKQIDAIINL